MILSNQQSLACYPLGPFLLLTPATLSRPPCRYKRSLYIDDSIKVNSYKFANTNVRIRTREQTEAPIFHQTSSLAILTSEDTSNPSKGMASLHSTWVAHWDYNLASLP